MGLTACWTSRPGRRLWSVVEGQGQSDGRSTSLPARFQQDADAALEDLQQRADVRGGRIGIIEVSFGDEAAIGAAARHPEWRATVLTGVQFGRADIRLARRWRAA